jgi:hypothetical protein
MQGDVVAAHTFGGRAVQVVPQRPQVHAVLTGLGQVRALRGGRTHARLVRSPGRTHHRARPVRAGRDFHLHLAAGRVIAERHRRAPAQTGGSFARDLPDQADDLAIGQRVLGDRTSGAAGHQRGGLAHGELQRVGALLVQDLNEAVESGHGGSQSRGRMKRTCILLM